MGYNIIPLIRVKPIKRGIITQQQELKRVVLANIMDDVNHTIEPRNESYTAVMHDRQFKVGAPTDINTFLTALRSILILLQREPIIIE